ncbi:MAG: hypothetical protein JXA99_11820 [Candidatus Lokiarchaeota archaeon]|nr:hypothetical protein [Candidatus Lokiarchaeota archaeon]
MSKTRNKYLRMIINIIAIISCIINFNCNNKIKNNGYKKIKNKNLVKIDYLKYIEKSSENDVNLSFSEFPQTLNPYRAVTPSEIFFKRSLFSSLFYLDSKTGLPEKNLIDKAAISNDGLVNYFTLKDNIKFNNGIRLDSEDVVASLKLLNTVLKDTEIYKNFFLLNKELNFESISSNEFMISSDAPNGNLLYALSDFPIIPKEIANKISEDFKSFIDFWELKDEMNIIGSGPYELEEINEKNIVLAKNQFYFKKDKSGNQLPYTKRINVKFYHDKNNEILGFLNNETDVVSITYDDYNLLSEYYKKTSNIKVRFIETNLSKNKVLTAYNCYKENSKSYLKDNEFRKYLSFFIKNSIKDEEKEFKTNDKDLFKDINHDGILEYKDEETIFLRIIAIEEEKEIVEIAEKVKKILEELKFDVYLEIVPLYLFLEKMFVNFDYDISFFYYSFDPGIVSYFQLLNKDELPFYPYVYDNNVSSEKIIKKLEDCINTLSNKNQLEEIKKLQNIFIEINQLFPIYVQNEYYLTKSNIYNLKINSSLEESYNLKTIETIINSSLK